MIKGEFEIAVGGKLTPITAWEFAVFGYFNCIVHRDVRRPKEWAVSEPRCGGFICRGSKTRKGAISEAHTKLYSVGTQEEVLGRIQQMISIYGPTKYELKRLAKEEEDGRLGQDQ